MKTAHSKLRKDFHNEEKGEKNKSKSEFIFASFLNQFHRPFFIRNSDFSRAVRLKLSNSKGTLVPTLFVAK